MKRDVAMCAFAMLGVLALLFSAEFGIWAAVFGLLCSVVSAVFALSKPRRLP